MPSPSRTTSYYSNYSYNRPSSPSVRFSQSRDRFGSPDRSKSTVRNIAKKKTCMCSPTTHPGSFRCSLHKNMMMTSNSSNRLNVRRSAMMNSLVRYGKSDQREGDLVKRALAALIRPSSHHQRRRTAFEPKPSRLSIMFNAVC
ncbi:uncharacterized protein [Rutidosis leptorrhynchoides]|uniref:uncharacterized protein n=1 Tax=Rutidosis leptorrhynchoides TaxID=125765 RepID=UPI003A9A3AE1